ncbi:MAG: HEAT repeat domain-containing protein [Chloroflexota bacterium]
MNKQKNSFDSVLDSLLDTKKEFPHRYLTLFSDIGPLELKTLLDVWPRVDLKRKLFLFKELETQADTDTLVNFDEFARPFLNDPEAEVRIHALRLLGECEDVKLTPIYLDLLKHDANADVRAQTANTLGYFVALGELDEIEEGAYNQVQAALLESTRGDEVTRVRRQALESLGYASKPEVVVLIESAMKHKDSEWQASALIAMGRSADERWEDEILRVLIDENDGIRFAAVKAAGTLSLKSARTVLLRMLAEGEEDDEIIAAAIWSLSQIGGEDVRTFLEALLDQTEEAEDEDQIALLEEALDNLAFTEDLDRFELMAIDPDVLDDFEDDENEDEDAEVEIDEEEAEDK